jgi:Protein of unknown function (DUF2584)
MISLALNYNQLNRSSFGANIMGMPCEVNSILKLSQSQGYPTHVSYGNIYTATKSGYRILPVDTPILLVNDDWLALADVIIDELIWANETTCLRFKVDRIYDIPFPVKKVG